MVSFSTPITRYSSSFFSFKLKQANKNIQLKMKFPDRMTNTRSLPHTVRFLRKNVPSILKCQCFNDDGLPFSEEVKHTEIAHLFEHILLDQLCREKARQVDAEYSGKTEWDWQKHPVGSFKVTVESRKSEQHYLAVALNRTIKLMEELYVDSGKPL